MADFERHRLHGEKEVDDEMVEQAKLIVNGKEYTVERILKDGTNYIKIRDIADVLGYEVTSKGSIAVLTNGKENGAVYPPLFLLKKGLTCVSPLLCPVPSFHLWHD